MELEFMLFTLPLMTDIEKAPENMQMKLIDLQCDTNLIQKFSETKLQDFYTYLPNDTPPQLMSLGLRMTAMFGSTCVCKQVFPLMNNKKDHNYPMDM
jgi:hypothetical protein